MFPELLLIDKKVLAACGKPMNNIIQPVVLSAAKKLRCAGVAGTRFFAALRMTFAGGEMYRLFVGVTAMLSNIQSYGNAVEL